MLSWVNYAGLCTSIPLFGDSSLGSFTVCACSSTWFHAHSRQLDLEQHQGSLHGYMVPHTAWQWAGMQLMLYKIMSDAWHNILTSTNVYYLQCLEEMHHTTEDISKLCCSLSNWQYGKYLKVPQWHGQHTLTLADQPTLHLASASHQALLGQGQVPLKGRQSCCTCRDQNCRMHCVTQTMKELTTVI